MDKKVSIIIPVYNGANYLKEAIDSALAQEYKNIEILVINDGSNDNGKTKKVAESYGNKIRYFEKENGGVSTALNLGLKNMTGEYFSWLSHDDKYKKDKISLQMKYLEENNLIDEKVILYTNYDMIDKKSKYLWTEKYESEISEKKQEYAILRGQINGITLLIPKKAFDECGNFDETLRCTQDYDLWWKMMKKYRFIHLDQVTSESRLHPSQTTNRSSKVETEGNILWMDMIKDLSKKDMVRLEGSEYAFYSEMAKFLTTRSYEEALSYCRTMASKLEKNPKNKKDIEEYKNRILVKKDNHKEEGQGVVKKLIRSIHTSGLKTTLKRLVIKVRSTIKKR